MINKRTFAAFTGMSAVTLATVMTLTATAEPASTASTTPQHTQRVSVRPSLDNPRTLPVPCRAMLPVPSYKITFEDRSAFTVPSGRSQVRKAINSSDTRRDLEIQCAMIVRQYAADLERKFN